MEIGGLKGSAAAYEAATTAVAAAEKGEDAADAKTDGEHNHGHDVDARQDQGQQQQEDGGRCDLADQGECDLRVMGKSEEANQVQVWWKGEGGDTGQAVASGGCVEEQAVPHEGCEEEVGTEGEDVLAGGQWDGVSVTCSLASLANGMAEASEEGEGDGEGTEAGVHRGLDEAPGGAVSEEGEGDGEGIEADVHRGLDEMPSGAVCEEGVIGGGAQKDVIGEDAVPGEEVVVDSEHAAPPAGEQHALARGGHEQEQRSGQWMGGKRMHRRRKVSR